MSEKNKKIISKTLSRLAAIQAIYAYEINKNEEENRFDIHTSILDVITLHEEETEEKLSKDFLSKLVILTYDNLDKIDELISINLNKHDNIEKLNLLLRCILRCAVCELKFYETPFKVVIDEYVALTKDFFSDSEINFVNAILDKIQKDT